MCVCVCVDRQCSLLHEAERKHREKLQSILDELATQYSPPPTPVVESSGSSLAADKEDFVVDEEVVQKHMELSQRLSSISCKSLYAKIILLISGL